MKQLTKYIIEKILINKNTKVNIFDGIDIYEWEWPQHGMSDQVLKQCKGHVYDFAEKYFKNNQSPISELFKQTIKLYFKNQYSDDNKINNLCDDLCYKLENDEWSHFEYHCIPQGWWHFTNWLIEQYKLIEQYNKQNKKK